METPLPEIELTPRWQRTTMRNGLVTARDGLEKAQPFEHRTDTSPNAPQQALNTTERICTPPPAFPKNRFNHGMGATENKRLSHLDASQDPRHTLDDARTPHTPARGF